jgi:chemotaxis protein MotA
VLPVIGIVLVVGLVFGGYLGAGGSMTIILKALPFEMVMIGGAALGAFVLGNDMATIKNVGKDIARVFNRHSPSGVPTDVKIA